MRSHRGVTMVELVMVISISMILAAVSIVGFQGVQSWRAASAVKRLRADFRHARNLAMLSSRRTALVIVDEAAMTYELRQEAAPSAGSRSLSVLTHPVTGQDWSVTLGGIAAGLSLQSNNGPSDGVIGFDADGMPIDSGGALWGGDIDLLFSTGAAIHVAWRTGIAEVIWP